MCVRSRLELFMSPGAHVTTPYGEGFILSQTGEDDEIITVS